MSISKQFFLTKKKKTEKDSILPLESLPFPVEKKYPSCAGLSRKGAEFSKVDHCLHRALVGRIHSSVRKLR